MASWGGLVLSKFLFNFPHSNPDIHTVCSLLKALGGISEFFLSFFLWCWRADLYQAVTADREPWYTSGKPKRLQPYFRENIRADACQPSIPQLTGLLPVEGFLGPLLLPLSPPIPAPPLVQMTGSQNCVLEGPTLPPAAPCSLKWSSRVWNRDTSKQLIKLFYFAKTDDTMLSRWSRPAQISLTVCRRHGHVQFCTRRIVGRSNRSVRSCSSLRQIWICPETF